MIILANWISSLSFNIWICSFKNAQLKLLPLRLFRGPVRIAMKTWGKQCCTPVFFPLVLTLFQKLSSARHVDREKPPCYKAIKRNIPFIPMPHRHTHCCTPTIGHMGEFTETHTGLNPLLLRLTQSTDFGGGGGCDPYEERWIKDPAVQERRMHYETSHFF